MKPTKVEGVQCRCCGALLSDEDAEGLESHGLETGLELWQCPECMEVYQDRTEAKDCCE